jgi:hypothetical protein
VDWRAGDSAPTELVAHVLQRLASQVPALVQKIEQKH